MTARQIKQLALRLAQREHNHTGYGATMAGIRALARRCGVSPRTAENWAFGRKPPSPAAARLLEIIDKESRSCDA